MDNTKTKNKAFTHSIMQEPWTQIPQELIFHFLHVYTSMGKTTLLVHIARRQLAIPPNIDVLLCEQGMSAKSPSVKFFCLNATF